MRGRSCASWQKNVSVLPVAQMVRELVAAGFEGIYLDRAALSDRGARWEADLMTLLPVPPLVSDNARFAYFDISKERCGQMAEGTGS